MKLEAVVDALRALADPIRLRIVHLLWAKQGREWCVNELVEVLDLPQPTISRHLAILRSECLVEQERDGTFRYYRLCDVQSRLHSTVLAALESFVSSAVEARLDLERAERFLKTTLISQSKHETKRFHVEGVENWEDEAAMSQVFKALGHPTRRRMMDRVGRSQGCTLGALADGFQMSRAAVAKHVGVLERAGLIHSAREGRERRLFADAVPVQLIYDRWTTRFTAPLAAHVTGIKYQAEAPTHDR